MQACVAGKLSEDIVQFSDEAACTVVLAAPGYPGKKKWKKIESKLYTHVLSRWCLFYQNKQKYFFIKLYCIFIISY